MLAPDKMAMTYLDNEVTNLRLSSVDACEEEEISQEEADGEL